MADAQSFPSVIAAIPSEVLDAQRIQWGVFVDAYLTNVARIGDRYAASAFLSRSGLVLDGETVATPEVRTINERQGFTLLQSLCGRDHYVIVNWLRTAEASIHARP